jgi:hypothetical protein
MNFMNQNTQMDCQEFEILGLDSSHDTTLGGEVRQRASHHAWSCAKCAALRASWNEAQSDLATLADSTLALGVPARIETRVLQQFRVWHQSRQEQKTTRLAGWLLAAAALLLCTLSVWNWQKWRHGSTGNLAQVSGVEQIANLGSVSAGDNNVEPGGSSEVFTAENDSGDFTRLPGSFAQETEEAALVRVGMQRASLGALGLPVDEERASEWIQVDLLVAADGSPQAVRLPQ